MANAKTTTTGFLLEVYQDGARLCVTEYQSCAPSVEQIKSMKKKAGCKVLVNGKAWKENK